MNMFSFEKPFFFRFFLEMLLFPSIFIPLPFSLFIDNLARFPLADGASFLPCDHGLDF